MAEKLVRIVLAEKGVYMKKIIVIGSPGAGKSCFSKKLALFTGINLFHMDNLYWRSDRTHITHDELVEKLREIMSDDSWIIDGNYISTLELRVNEADTVFYMDYPTDICIEGIRGRIGKKRDDIPWTEQELDDDFLKFVESFCTDTKPRIEEMLKKYTDKTLYRFCGRDDADEFLKG